MTITKQRALAAVRRNGRLLRFVQKLDAETVVAWDLEEIEGTQAERDAFVADYIDEVRKEHEGDDVIGEMKKMRRILEREVAFLHFRGTGSSRPKTSVYRVPCMTAYNGAGYAQRQMLKCLLTGMEFPSDKVLAAHIFQHEWEDRRPLIAAGLSIDGPENVIPCYETVGKALDQLHITLEPTAPNPPTFTVRVLDRSMLQTGQWVVKTDACALLWSELDGKEVDFTGVDCATDGPPLSALVCAIHMRAALRKAEMNMWIRAGSYQVPRWAQQLVKNPASGLTESFLRSAAQLAHASPADTPSDEHRSAPFATAADSHSAET
ncbi:hypothetical protein V8C86DRAFT_2516066 [Haematococcus lacustris]